jgi:hypothetical protein
MIPKDVSCPIFRAVVTKGKDMLPTQIRPEEVGLSGERVKGIYYLCLKCQAIQLFYEK